MRFAKNFVTWFFHMVLWAIVHIGACGIFPIRYWKTLTKYAVIEVSAYVTLFVMSNSERVSRNRCLTLNNH